MSISISIAITLVIIIIAVVFLKWCFKGKPRQLSPLLVQKLSTSHQLMGRLRHLLGSQTVNDTFWGELETALIESDVGIDVTARLLKEVQGKSQPNEIKQILAEQMTNIFPTQEEKTTISPHVILVLGVNGVGKTTTIAKLARRYSNDGKRVLLVAADTFRAAAVDQLKEWGKRLGLDVVAQGSGADAAAVAFDGVSKAVSKGYDVVIIDTAGRLHTKSNLMDELKKVIRVIGKALPGAPHERLLVIDATVGSNGLVQAREFNEVVNLTGIIAAKLDGTAKGGVLFAIAQELNIPIRFVGLGEKMDDLIPFDSRAFVASILGPNPPPFL